jgi:hypothetical protein
MMKTLELHLSDQTASEQENDLEFQKAMEYVLRKNAELYRRLA